MVGITLHVKFRHSAHLVSVSLHQAHQNRVVLLILKEQIEDGIGGPTPQQRDIQLTRSRGT